MGTKDQAVEVVQKVLDSCVKSSIQGRIRLCAVRKGLVDAGFEHRDTIKLCRELGFTTMGLTILSYSELGRQRRVS